MQRGLKVSSSPRRPCSSETQSQCKEDWKCDTYIIWCKDMDDVSMQRGLKGEVIKTIDEMTEYSLNAKRIESIRYIPEPNNIIAIRLNAKRIERLVFCAFQLQHALCLNAKRIERLLAIACLYFSVLSLNAKRIESYTHLYLSDVFRCWSQCKEDWKFVSPREVNVTYSLSQCKEDWKRKQ